jgi:hypothetical protein
MRYSLRELLLIVAICAGFLACFSWLGFDNGMVWFVAFVSLIMSAFFYFRAHSEKSRRFAWTVPIWFLGIGILAMLATFVSLALLINVVTLMLFGAYCARRPVLPRKTLVMCIAVCALISFVGGMLPGISQNHQLQAIRTEFPIKSLVNRLSYERRNRTTTLTLQLSPVVLTKLSRDEQELSAGSYREWQFKRIHERNFELFSRSIGFGIGRMMEPDANYLRKPPLRDIRFDEVEVVSSEEPFSYWRKAYEDSNSEEPEQLHVFSRYDFLEPDSFGVMIESKDKVIGLIPHAMHHSPTAGLKNHSTWTIERLELVSMLRFDEPRVYVLDHLPRMDQLSSDSVTTRMLDDFERSSLEKLRTDEDVVVAREHNKYRMLGSLRAATQCTNCHNVERGELLGAFSYAINTN